MFGKQFYPTPKETIRKMVAGLDLNHKRILDPSAGRGDILDYAKDRTEYDGYGNRRSSADLYAIEIDPDLRAVLAGKGYKVIDTDFLAYAGHRYFDLILMNPPFQDGAKHLLKAWDISRGAIIKCLLPTETLNNSYTQDRQRLAHLVSEYGSVQDLGQPFTTADRATPVHVSLITLQDPAAVERFRLDFDPATVGESDYHLDDLQANELASANVFENYEARFNAAIGAFKELLAARQKVAYYLDGLLPEHGKNPTDMIAESLKKPGPTLAYDDFLTTANTAAWDNIFQKTKLRSVTTEGVRDEIEKMQAQQGTMAFTASNMEDLFYLLALNREQIMVQCVLEAFDNLTRHYPENRIEVEGWKTNSSYRVGKFILPNIGSYYGSGIDYRAGREIEDLEKALCFISGKRFEDITHITDIYRDGSHYHEWMESEFFETKLFKKGTMHFRWLDQKLCDDFNALVAKHRWGWVPEKTKQGVYQ